MASPKDKEHALDFTYMYGYPLLEYGKFASAFPDARTNTLYHDRRLSTSDDFKVIRPNVDTLYSVIFMDLCSHNLQITIPEIEDRYWVFPFYDPYGNDIGNIGSLQGYKPGKYLVRISDDNFGFFSGPPPENESHRDYRGYINFPTSYGICLARIATTPTIRDQDMTNQFQDQIKVSPIKRPGRPAAPPLDLSMFSLPEHRPSGKASVVPAVLRLTAALAPCNMSPILQDRPWLSDILKASGIGQDASPCPSETDTSRVSQFAETQALAILKSPGGTVDHGNGWRSSYPDCLGNFKSCYAARYSIAKRGYLALTNDQAWYPSLKGALVIRHNEAILLRFSRRPVLVPTGFWSLTAYNAEQYLIPNTINRYCLGDRDNMTFPDGSSLADQTKDGEFCILLQPADITPPAEWMNNWLPAPSGGGKFSITLRWYGATKEMMTKSYEYPKIEYINAMTASGRPML